MPFEPLGSAAFNNYVALAALSEVDEEKAIQVISDPLLDQDELSEILTNSLMGNVVDIQTRQPIKLSNKVVMAGMRNKMAHIEAALKNSGNDS